MHNLQADYHVHHEDNCQQDESGQIYGCRCSAKVSYDKSILNKIRDPGRNLENYTHI